MVFVQEYDSHRLGKIRGFKPYLEKSPSPSPVFVQVFISMGLRLTTCASYASGGFLAVFVGEEKTRATSQERTAPSRARLGIRGGVERQTSGSGQTCVIITRKY
jgi:hypothetical protein